MIEGQTEGAKELSKDEDPVTTSEDDWLGNVEGRTEGTATEMSGDEVPVKM